MLVGIPFLFISYFNTVKRYAITQWRNEGLNRAGFTITRQKKKERENGD